MLFRKALAILFGGKRYLFRDEFSAGSTPNPAFWTITDTESKISVSAGNLVFSGGKATPAWADPALVSKAPYVWARVAGLTIEWQVTPGAANKFLAIGLSDSTGSQSTNISNAIWWDSTGVLAASSLSTRRNIPLAYSAAQVLWARIVLKATGAFYYVSTDNRATWYLIWVDSTVTTTPLYAFIESYNAALTASACYVYQGTVQPPLVNVAAGTVTPTVGAELLTDPGLEDWASATDLTSWVESLAGLTTINRESVDIHGGTYAARTDVVNGDGYGIYRALSLAAMRWVRASVWAKSSGGQSFSFGLGTQTAALIVTTTSYVQYFNTLRSTGLNDAIRIYRGSSGTYSMFYDDASLVPLTLSSLLGTPQTGSKQGIFDCSPKIDAGYQSGMIFNWDGDGTDAGIDGLLAYVDRAANAYKLVKILSGVYTELVTGSTYTADAQWRGERIDDGTNMNVAVYKAGVQVGTTQAMALATHGAIKDNTLMVPFQTIATDANNTPGTLVCNAGIGVA